MANQVATAYGDGSTALVTAGDLANRTAWGYDAGGTNKVNTFDAEDTKAWLTLDRAAKAVRDSGGGVVIAPGSWKVTRPLVCYDGVTYDFLFGTVENTRARTGSETGFDAIRLNVFACATSMHYAIFNSGNGIYHTPSTVSGSLGAAATTVTFADAGEYLDYSPGDDIMIRTAGEDAPVTAAVNPHHVENHCVDTVSDNQITLVTATGKDFGASPLVVRLGQVDDSVTGSPMTFTRDLGILNVTTICNGAFWNRCNFEGLTVRNVTHTGHDGSTANGLNRATIRGMTVDVQERGLEWKISQGSVIDGFHATLSATSASPEPLFSWGQLSSATCYNIKGVENSNANSSKFRVLSSMELTVYGLDYSADTTGAIVSVGQTDGNKYNGCVIEDALLTAAAATVDRFIRVDAVDEVTLTRFTMTGDVDASAGAVRINQADAGGSLSYRFVDSTGAAVSNNVGAGFTVTAL